MGSIKKLIFHKKKTKNNNRMHIYLCKYTYGNIWV